MLTDCHGVDISDEHWVRAMADVTAVSGQLIKPMASDGLLVSQLRPIVAEFHSCHVIALLSFHVATLCRMGATNEHVVEFLATAEDLHALP